MVLLLICSIKRRPHIVFTIGDSRIESKLNKHKLLIERVSATGSYDFCC